MNKESYIMLCVTLSVGFLLVGIVVGTYSSQTAMEAKAVEAGVAHWVVKNGDVKFEFKTR